MAKTTTKPSPKRRRPTAVLVRLTYAELAALHEYADGRGVPVATAVRLVALDAAHRNVPLPGAVPKRDHNRKKDQARTSWANG